MSAILPQFTIYDFIPSCILATPEKSMIHDDAPGAPCKHSNSLQRVLSTLNSVHPYAPKKNQVLTDIEFENGSEYPEPKYVTMFRGTYRYDSDDEVNDDVMTLSELATEEPQNVTMFRGGVGRLRCHVYDSDISGDEMSISELATDPDTDSDEELNIHYQVHPFSPQNPYDVSSQTNVTGLRGHHRIPYEYESYEDDQIVYVAPVTSDNMTIHIIEEDTI